MTDYTGFQNINNFLLLKSFIAYRYGNVVKILKTNN